MRCHLLCSVYCVCSRLLASCVVVSVGVSGCRPSEALRQGAQSGVARPATTASVVALIDVSVIPMDTERVLPHRTVVVENGRIVALQEGSAAKVPEGAVRVDGAGKFLMPGLCDAHVHLDGTASLELFVLNGVTSVRNMAGNALVLSFRERVARGELLGPRIVTAGPLLDGKD